MKNNAAARNFYGRALTIVGESGDQGGRARILCNLALVVREDGDLNSSRAMLLESISIRRTLGWDALDAVLNNLGELELRLGNDEAARAYLEESASYSRKQNTLKQLGETLRNLAVVALRQKRYREAEAHCLASLRTSYECGAFVDIPDTLDQMVLVALSFKRWESAAQLLGAAEGLRHDMGLPHAGVEIAEAGRAAEDALGERDFAAILVEGRRMSLDQVIAYASGATGEPTTKAD